MLIFFPQKCFQYENNKAWRLILVFWLPNLGNIQNWGEGAQSIARGLLISWGKFRRCIRARWRGALRGTGLLLKQRGWKTPDRWTCASASIWPKIQLRPASFKSLLWTHVSSFIRVRLKPEENQTQQMQKRWKRGRSQPANHCPPHWEDSANQSMQRKQVETDWTSEGEQRWGGGHKTHKNKWDVGMEDAMKTGWGGDYN